VSVSSGSHFKDKRRGKKREKAVLGVIIPYLPYPARRTVRRRGKGGRKGEGVKIRRTFHFPLLVVSSHEKQGEGKREKRKREILRHDSASFPLSPANLGGGRTGHERKRREKEKKASDPLELPSFSHFMRFRIRDSMGEPGKKKEGREGRGRRHGQRSGHLFYLLLRERAASCRRIQREKEGGREDRFACATISLLHSLEAGVGLVTGRMGGGGGKDGE